MVENRYKNDQYIFKLLFYWICFSLDETLDAARKELMVFDEVSKKMKASFESYKEKVQVWLFYLCTCKIVFYFIESHTVVFCYSTKTFFFVWR